MLQNKQEPFGTKSDTDMQHYNREENKNNLLGGQFNFFLPKKQEK